jgi:hypothetical protein
MFAVCPQPALSTITTTGDECSVTKKKEVYIIPSRISTRDFFATNDGEIRHIRIVLINLILITRFIIYPIQEEFFNVINS